MTWEGISKQCQKYTRCWAHSNHIPLDWTDTMCIGTVWAGPIDHPFVVELPDELSHMHALSFNQQHIPHLSSANPPQM